MTHTPDLEARVESILNIKSFQKPFYECFLALRAAEFIGCDHRTELVKEGVTDAIKRAEDNYLKALEVFKELTEQRAELLHVVKRTRQAIGRVKEKMSKEDLEKIPPLIRYNLDMALSDGVKLVAKHEGKI